MEVEKNGGGGEDIISFNVGEELMRLDAGCIATDQGTCLNADPLLN